MYDDLFIGRVSVFVTPCLVCLFFLGLPYSRRLDRGGGRISHRCDPKKIQCEEYKGGIFFLSKKCAQVAIFWLKVCSGKQSRILIFFFPYFPLWPVVKFGSILLWTIANSPTSQKFIKTFGKKFALIVHWDLWH
jgi:hypothetical protein